VAPNVQPGGISLEAAIGFRLGRTHRVLLSAWGETIADLGLSPAQAAALRVVADWPGSSLRGVARRLRTDPMNAKRLVDHLEGEALVRSASNPDDRRSRLLHATERGAALSTELGRRAAAWDRHLRTLLGAAELARLGALLDRLEASLETVPPALRQRTTSIGEDR
jgi:DNA-binding MarR family transcriptional regulator